MQDRFDPLIAERAPWLFSGGLWAGFSRSALMRLLSYDRTLRLAASLRDAPAARIMAAVACRIARDITVTGLDRIPRDGPALIVANHPTGIADGVVLFHILAPLRPDIFFYANSDILRILPQMTEIIAPVEWRPEQRCHSKTRATMAYTRDAMAAGRIGLIFPSGRLAKRRGLRLFERPWMASAAMIARRFGVPVVPVHIRARNSVLFYLFDLIHPTLRDITLFHETLNKARQPFRITVGTPFPAADLPARSEDGIRMLRRATLGLGGCHPSSVSLLESTRSPFRAHSATPAA